MSNLWNTGQTLAASLLQHLWLQSNFLDYIQLGDHLYLCFAASVIDRAYNDVLSVAMGFIYENDYGAGISSVWDFKFNKA